MMKLTSPSGSSTAFRRLFHDRHSGAPADQGQGRRGRAASADHSREQPRSTATTSTYAAATASKAELPSLDLHHPAGRREAAPRRHTAQTARPRRCPAGRATQGAGVDPGDAAAATATKQWRPLLRHPAAEGPRGQAAHHHPHPRPEWPATAATAADATEQGSSGPEGDPGPNAHEDRPSTATGSESDSVLGLPFSENLTSLSLIFAQTCNFYWTQIREHSTLKEFVLNFLC